MQKSGSVAIVVNSRDFFGNHLGLYSGKVAGFAGAGESKLTSVSSAK